MLLQGNHVYKDLCVIGIPVQSLLKGCIGLLVLPLSDKSDCLTIQQQGRSPELIYQLLVDIVGVLQLVATLKHFEHENPTILSISLPTSAVCIQACAS